MEHYYYDYYCHDHHRYWKFLEVWKFGSFLGQAVLSGGTPLRSFDDFVEASAVDGRFLQKFAGFSGAAAVTVDLQHLHLENEGGVSRDLRGRAASTISEVARRNDFNFVSFAHAVGHDEFPRIDHLVGGKIDGTSPFDGAIENIASSQKASVIVHLAACAFEGALVTGALLDPLDEHGERSDQ